MKKISLLLIFLLIVSTQTSYCFSIYNGSKNPVTIVVPLHATLFETHAATVLAGYLKQITGCDLKIVTDEAALATNEIIIGNNQHLQFLKKQINFSQLHKDGYVISSDKNYLYLAGGSERGIIYGVYAFLEKVGGCRKYSADCKVVPKKDTLVIPDNLTMQAQPQFDVREFYYWPTMDDEYMEWHALNRHMPVPPRHDNYFAVDTNAYWGLYVHTFNKLVPSEKYYDSHPEYYAYTGDKRQPTQLCLSNDTVFKILTENLAAEIKNKPGAKYWSVSQNDNFGYCMCERCRQVDSIEGNPSGSLIRFVNRVAQKFPDKIISTLAYEYSRSAPRITKPLPNVNIMFCSIECNRSKPIANDERSASFRNDLEAWSRLTHNIMVWDYVVQFSNYVAPFPNLKVLQPNIKYFASHGVNDMFQQGSGSNWSDFGELKAYLISNLLWNPDLNVDSLKADFLNGYYGAAASDVKAYISLMEHNLDASNNGLDIFGNPVSPHDSWLSETNLMQYDSLLAMALSKCNGDIALQNRISKIQITLLYAVLQQSKFYGTGKQGIFEKNNNGKWQVRNAIKNDLTTFTENCKRLGITSIHENNFPPAEYYTQWQYIFEHGMIEHLAMNQKVSFEIPFSPKYPAKGNATLTDGTGGYEDYHYNWLGWEGEDMVATVTFDSVVSFSTLQCNFMEDQKSWIFYPADVSFYYSTDNKKFKLFGKQKGAEPSPDKNALIKTYGVAKKKFANARYVKVVAHNFKTCPKWHIGAGNPCWIFCDEIVVK